MNSILNNNQSLEEKFDTLYHLYNKQIYYSAYNITKDHFLAQDAVQETFIKAFRHFDKWSNIKLISAWLNVTSRNTAIDMYRKRNRSMEKLDDCTVLNGGTVQGEAERFVGMKAFRELFSTLKPMHQQTLFLIYEYGLTYEELAYVQKSSISAVKSRIHRAKIEMKFLLQEAEMPC